jgi:diketogulonate reductase-like aldo/keto reductase
MELPRIGLGTWQSTDPVQLENAIIYAVEECGYRYIDTAQSYENENVVGAALQKIFAKGVIKRSDLWITTKLWVSNRRKQYVEPTLRASLAALQLDYVDLYLIHWPFALIHQDDGALFPVDASGKPAIENVDILETWGAFEELVEKKLTRFIGVSNFSIEMLERLYVSPQVKIQPFTNQVECSVYNQQWAMIQYLESRKLHLTAYSPLGSTGGTGPNGISLIQEPIILEVAKELGKTPAQVAIRYLLQSSPVVDVIPKSVTPKYIKQNKEVFDFQLTPEQVAKIRKLNVGWRHGPGIDICGYDCLAIGL